METGTETLAKWTGQFRNAAEERAYRDMVAHSDAPLLVAAAWACALFFASGLSGEAYLESPGGMEPAVVARLCVLLAALVVTLVLRGKPSAGRFEACVFGFAVVAMAASHLLAGLHAGMQVQGAVNLFVMLTVLYLLVPVRLLLVTGLALASSGVGFYAWGFANPSPPSAEDLRSIAVMLVLGNIVGFAFANRLHHTRRARYAHLRALDHEIGRRQGIEAQLREQTRRAEEGARAKSEFLAMMSHEIRTPMNGILGMLQLLRDTRLTAEQSDHVETIHHSAEALLAILNDILDFSKLEAGRLEIETTDVDLLRLVASINQLMQSRAAEKGLTLTLDIGPDVPRWVHTDSTRTRQILLNLVGNAVKFTDRGGVTVALRAVGRDGDATRVRFIVSDTGIGIPEAALGRLFGQFVQADGSISRRFGGTGLGLAICKRLVGLLGGSIGVDSEEGRGSSFWFELPLPEGSETGAAVAERIDIPPLRLLLVEDHPVNQKVALGLLARRGHTVDVANHGFEALGMVQAAKYDAVLMDMQMPVLDGLQATAKIRALGGAFATLPIIAMTANALKGDAERCLAAGMNGYVAKPIDPVLLDAALAEHVLRRPVAVAVPAAALDHDKLAELEQALGPEATRGLVMDFLRHAGHAVEGILAACQRSEAVAVYRLAHDLKSLAGTFGFVALRHLAEAIELASREGRHEEVSRLAASLPDRLEQASGLVPQAAA